jgi:hypothetical protein
MPSYIVTVELEIEIEAESEEEAIEGAKDYRFSEFDVVSHYAEEIDPQ